METAQQLAFLKEHGCTYAQGFLFSMPVPYAEFAAFATELESTSLRLAKGAASG